MSTPVRTRARRHAACAWGLAGCLIALSTGCASKPAVKPPARVEAAPPTVTPLERLRQDIQTAIAGPGVRRGAWGIVVHSLDRDERLFALNADVLLVPASATKLVSAATAADAVGWDFRFRTLVRATGPLVDGVVRGDLIVTGSGDPSIGGRGGDDLSVWIDALKAAGIRRIEGRIIGDDDQVEEPRPQLAWAWDDLGYPTGVLFGALNVAENRMVATVTPGAAAGLPTTLGVEPYAAPRALANRTVTVAPDGRTFLWPEQRPGEPFLTVAGSIAAGSPALRVSISAGNPTFWFASVLRNRLLTAGIPVAGEAFDIDDVQPPPDRASANVLLTLTSRPLSEIAQPMLKNSINLYGEAFLRLNAPAGVFPTNDAALEGLAARLTAWGIARDAQQLVDGSGLSRRNVISADAIVMVLRRMHDATGASPFVRGLPVAGVDGSLAERMKGTAAEGRVRAKTGTMSNVRSLAGYATTRDGEHVALVIVVNNFEGTGADANRALDAIAIRLAEFSR